MEIQLSVVIITFNEEKNIARCIDSVQEVANDIVVVDSFSTDRTKEICLEKGVRFTEHAFEGHVEQKNYAITQAKYPYILSLDADEALTPELEASINEAKQNWKADGYKMNRLTSYCGKWIRHGDWYPDRKLRLWDSRKGKWGGTNPHDKFMMEDGTTIMALKGDLLHYSFHSISQHLDQIDKFSEIGAKELFKKGKKATFFHLYIKPTLKFFFSYIIKRGFLDGFYGYVVCKNSAHARFLRYAKLKDLYNQQQ